MTIPSAQLYPQSNEIQQTKICNCNTCAHGGISQSVENFYVAKKGSQRRLNQCKTCIRKDHKLAADRARLNRIDPPKEKVCCRRSCSHNGALQPIAHFYKRFNVRSGVYGACKTCIDNGIRKWRNNHQEYDKARCNKWYKENLKHCKEYAHQTEIDPKYKNNRQWTKARWVAYTVSRCRKRASEKNLPFNIDGSDLVPLPEFCPVFAVRLDYNAGPEKRIHAAVDKIIPSLGYVKGNVRIISNAANWAKLNGIGDIVVVKRRLEKKPAVEQPYLFLDFKRQYEAAD